VSTPADELQALVNEMETRVGHRLGTVTGSTDDASGSEFFVRPAKREAKLVGRVLVDVDPAATPSTFHDPAFSRLVRFAPGALEALARDVHCIVEWGEPDADGVWTPVLRKTT